MTADNKAARPLTRRDWALISGAAAGMTALTVGVEGILHGFPITPGAPPPIEDKPTFGISFGDKDLDEVAKKAGITPGDFFKFSARTLDSLKAYNKNELYPIFPPSVLQHKKLIYDLSSEFGTPPNIVAVIMTIESCGNKDAESWVGAQGLFQVMPFHFRPEIRDNPRAMKEPYENGRVGMRYFVRDCMPAARVALRTFSENHPAVFGRALIAYNGGPGTAARPFDSLPEESKFYGDHLIRFVITAELADKIRHDKKMTDAQIVKKLSSKEIDARAAALRAFVDGTGRSYPYVQYETVITELSKAVPGEPYGKDYNAYKANSTYVVPASPGLRIWLNMGGIDLFSRDPRNLDPKTYDSINSHR